MPDLPFHEAVRRWFATTLGEPTPAQAGGWESIRQGRHTLIAAPTGSGKTLAAFLHAIDGLFREGLGAGLPAETRVVYVSPLKALSADIHKNLEEPLQGIRETAVRLGLEPPDITAAVRSGDTPASQRAAMLRSPPHILVTTPESLYLLLTAQRSREMLRTVTTVIVDEIHAVLDSRRGAHQALTLQRLEHVATGPVQRIGLSATQRPIETVAEYLVGMGAPPTRATAPREEAAVAPERTGHAADRRFPAIVDHGHRRRLDLALELPGSPLEAVMAHEVWEEVYDRLRQLIEQHETTLVFVNTRRMAERVAARLSSRLGEQGVAAHHGSLARETRLDVEDRLRTGQLKALVATASLELGIDIGHVDLVCQLGSPHRINTFVQRVGRSGHTIRGTPKGRLFPLSRDDLVECAALLRAVAGGDLDRLAMFEQPLDVLAQQMVAESACEDWGEVELFDLFRGAYPYRHLELDEFRRVVRMVSEGYTTRRGRRGALVHYDGVNRRLRGRRAARLTAITAGGAIPDNADYRVILDPEETFVGTVNEDFAIESIVGDIFQLGNASWRILSVNSGTVRVADATGEPPTIPFWFGEAPGRSQELSAAVSQLRKEIDTRLDAEGGRAGQRGTAAPGPQPAAVGWLVEALHLPEAAAQQIVTYLSDAKHILGVIPTQDTIVLERFFDEAGGMQLILHAPFGSRVNRAWGLALRKKFCRQFNFELQAAATEEGLLLSLGPQHSFPLEDVFRYLHPNVLRNTLIQALIDSPLFPTRWRWNATISLAVLRNRGGKRVPPPLQRMEADDLLATAFPDAAACLENIGGDREIPDHPLVSQTIEDCLQEAMDLSTLTRIVQRIFDGAIECVSRDTPEPSVLSHELLNSAPYSYLDNEGEIAERRARAVQTRRATEPSSADELGRLDADAISRVADEAWPEPRNADELHDALMTAGYLTEVEGINARGASWKPYFEELVAAARATRFTVRTSSGKTVYWVATERAGELTAIWSGRKREGRPAGSDHRSAAAVELAIDPPVTPVGGTDYTRERAVREVVRGRLTIVGPTTAGVLAASMNVTQGDIDVALLALEGEGVILRGSFTPNAAGREWCDRRLLARIHRYTLNRLRAEIEPVAPADFVRFLFAWQRVDPQCRMSGLEGLAAVAEQLDGYELPAGAWEADVLGSRLTEYDPLLLDSLCLTGRVAWGRLSPPMRPGSGPFSSGPIRSTPVSLFLREHAEAWRTLAPRGEQPPLSTYARGVLEALERQGASFFAELAAASGLLPTQVEQALGELVAHGLVTADSFAGLRALLIPSDRRKPLRGARRARGRPTAPFGVEAAGRWSVLSPPAPSGAAGGRKERRTEGVWEEAVEAQAWALLRRYGVVFRRLLHRETNLAPWRDLAYCYRRLEARGEIRGGRFVAGMSGEQFALPEAVGQMRTVRRAEPSEQLIGISAADPLNLTGILTPGDRIPALATNRVVYRDGVPLAAREGKAFRLLAEVDAELERALRQAVVRRAVPPALRIYLGKTG